MNFLLGILEGGGSVDEHPLIQHLLDLFWLLMEVWSTFTLQKPVRSVYNISLKVLPLTVCVCVCFDRITR